jgi:hypothetical protein
MRTLLASWFALSGVGSLLGSIGPLLERMNHEALIDQLK